MPLEDKQRPIVIKRVVKGGHGHHGGAWKVAFADFVTAMMAFFLVMWIVGATTTDQKAAISQYFQNPSLTEGMSQSPSPGPMGPGGASTSMIDFGGSMDLSRGEGRKVLEQVEEGKERPEEKERLLKVAQDKHRLETLMETLKEAIGKSQALEPFKDQLFLDITPEGLRIQIVDKENRPMFDMGSSHLKAYTAEILHELAKFVNGVPNQLSIAGHTDVTPFVSRRNYSNWELSADRANAARRALLEGGMTEDKISRVVGLASSILFDRAQPRSPINRRISIVVMNLEASESLKQEHGDREAVAPAFLAGEETEDATAVAEDDVVAVGSSATGTGTDAAAMAVALPRTPAASARESRAADSGARRPANSQIQRPRPIELPPIIDPTLLPRVAAPAP